MNEAPAGWILNPNNPSLERWWDGERFTAQTRPIYASSQMQAKHETTNTLAIVAFILSFLLAIVGVILGHISRAQIRRDGTRGDGLAIAALVIGYVQIGVFLLVGLVTVAIVGSLDPPY